MQYLVSIENRPYHHWQIDLLIESFKLKGVEGQLVVALAEHHGQKYKQFGRNLVAHKHVYRHQNYGRIRNLPGLNKAYSVAALLANGKIQQPFCLIEPDMILLNPVQQPNEQFSFSPDVTFSLEVAEAAGLKVREKGADKLWLPVGGVMYFNGVPPEFFTRAVEWGEGLENERRAGGDEMSCRLSARAGWAMAAADHSKDVTIGVEPRYEATLLENDTGKNFAHYQHGLPPVWNKRLYQFDPDEGDFRLGGPDPFETLLENNPTAVTNELQTVIRSYQGR